MKLGSRQKTVLECIEKSGWWPVGAGWTYGTYSETVRILESLLKLGLVEVESVGKFGDKNYKARAAR